MMNLTRQKIARIEMPAMRKPKHNLTYSEALQLRALGRIRKVRARKEPDKRLRLERMQVANAAIRKAESALNPDSKNPA